MAGVQVLHFNELPDIDRGVGITTKKLAGPWNGAQGFTTGVSTQPPGTQIRFHSHNVDEAVVVLQGEALFEAEGESHRLKPFDTTFVPTGVSHRFANLGSGVMRILWVYAGNHVTRTLTETGVTNEHLSAGDLMTKSQRA